MGDRQYIKILKNAVGRTDRAADRASDLDAHLAGVSHAHRLEAQINRLGAAYLKKLAKQRKKEMDTKK